MKNRSRKKRRNRYLLIICIFVAAVAVYVAASQKWEEKTADRRGIFQTVADAFAQGAEHVFQIFSEEIQQVGTGIETQNEEFANSETTEKIRENTEQEEEPAEDAVKAELSMEDASIVEAAAMEQAYQKILQLPAGELAAEGWIAHELADRLFFGLEINDEILERINGTSYTPNEYIQPAELSYLRMLYYGADGNTYVGEMIVNKQIEAEVLTIFRELYENQYPIERMELVDNYNAEDEASMENNNTSAFNYRTISGSSKLSNHSYGMAIDLNPKYNPYVKTAADGSVTCQPAGSLEYADRSKEFMYKIDETDLAYQLFTQAGFTWGGNWNSVKDYQHFEKE